MTNVEPSFVLYALFLDLGCCLRAYIILIELVEPGKKNQLASEPHHHEAHFQGFLDF